MALVQGASDGLVEVEQLEFDIAKESFVLVNGWSKSALDIRCRYLRIAPHDHISPRCSSRAVVTDNVTGKVSTVTAA